MKRIQSPLLSALLLSLLTMSATHAQTPANAGSLPPSPAGPAPKGPHKPGGRAPQAMMSLTAVSGTVGQLTANDDGILNGFTLNNGSATTAVRFGAHLGQQVNGAVKVGSRVSVTGYTKTGPQGETTFQLVKMDVGNTQVVDSPPTKAPSPLTPVRQTVTSQIADYQIGRDGKTNGLVLSNQTLVKVPPHVAGQLVALAPKGSAITVDGYAQPLGEGQVQLQKRTVLRASILTLNGQSYLVQ